MLLLLLQGKRNEQKETKLFVGLGVVLLSRQVQSACQGLRREFEDQLNSMWAIMSRIVIKRDLVVYQPRIHVKTFN